MSDERRRQYVWMALALVMVAAVTAFHYWTDAHEVALHNVYRRLVYIPIVIGAFAAGLRGGLAVALTATAVYIPHAFLMSHGDPAPTIDKSLEIVLYLSIGGLTGYLVDHQKKVRRRLERSLAERDVLESELIRAGKHSALGQLTAGLAHEVRNPLASIQGSAEALAEEFPPEHRKYRMSVLLLREIDRLNQVVTDFLRFARPAEPRRRRVDLHELVSKVASFAQRHSTELSVNIEIHTSPGELVVHADPDQLRQVLLNLYLNAQQALERAAEGDQAPEEPTIHVVSGRRLVAGRGFLCLGIVDNGPGISPELQDEVIDPYVTTRHEGTGLGLSVSSRILEAHGGFLDLESRPGETTVWICLPEEK